MAYRGLDERLKREVFERDRWRCRWAGETNCGLDAHHVEYRRGYSFDRIDNLISLCRQHHDFVHGTPNGSGDWIGKVLAQEVLTAIIDVPHLTGAGYLRRLRVQWAREGKCARHGMHECPDCPANLDARPDDDTARLGGGHGGRRGADPEDQAGSDVRFRLHLVPRRRGSERRSDPG